MLSENIRLLRKKHKFSQSALAKKLNITQQAVQKWEKGRSEPDTEMIKKISIIFNISIDDLLDDKINNNDFEIFIENSHLQNRIKQLREEKGWSQSELGEKLNLQKAAISKYESGKVPLTDLIIEKLVKIFDESSDYILGISSERKNIAIKKDIVNGQEIEIGYDKREYPDGLTHTQVLEILENLKKMGFQLPKGKGETD